RRTRSGIRDGPCVFPVMTLSRGSGRRSAEAPWLHRAAQAGARGLTAAGSEGEKMKIADILDTKGSIVHSVLPWITVAEVVEQLDTLGIGAVLVCDEPNSIKGIVSERDIVRALRKHGTTLLTMPVSEVMTHYVQTTKPDETIAHAMARMTSGRYR